jgi:predicted O-methyltransferase YrrM
MNPAPPLDRRAFLAALGGVASASGCAASPDAAPAGAPGAAAGAVLAELEGRGSQLLNVARQEGQLLHLLARYGRARRILEVGTSFGYSALWLGLALAETGGRLTTIDINPERLELARENLRRAGLSGRVTCREGDGHALVRTLPGPFDLVFLDADKDGNLDYFQQLHPGKLAPGGLLAAHSVLTMGHFMKDFLEALRARPDFDTATLNAGGAEGLFIACRRRVAGGSRRTGAGQ